MRILTNILLVAFLTLFPGSAGVDSAFAQGIENLSPSEKSVQAFLSADWDTSIELLRSDDRQAQSATARLLLGHALLASNRNNEAYVLFTSVTDRSDLERYLSYCQKLISDLPSSAFAHYLLGDAFARVGDYDQSRRAFDDAIKLDSAKAILYVARGVAHATTGDPDKAILDLSRAIELDSQLADGWLALGVLLTRLGAIDGAEKALARSLQSNQNLALAHLTSSVLAYGNGDFERAFSELDNARTLEPRLATLLDYNEIKMTTSLERLRAISVDSTGQDRPGAPMRSAFAPAKDMSPKTVAEWMPGSGRAVYFGDKLPELKSYYEPPRTPQFTAQRERRVVHDQIVQHTDYSKVVDLMNESIALIGIRTARPNDPATRGPIESAKLQNDGRVPAPWANATRLTVLDDGTYALRRVDPRTGTWQIIPKPEAIDFLNSLMSYRQQRRASQDISHERIFEATTGRKWQPVFADFPNLKVSQLVQLPPNTPLEFTYKSERHQMTVGSFLAGNLPKLRVSLETEAYQSKQFNRLAQPSSGWSSFLSKPDLPKREPRIREYFSLANCVPCGGGPRGPGGPPPGGPPHGRNPAVPPGGVSTKELANVWVNRGDWQLETEFTLGYGKAKPSSGSSNR